MTAIPAKTLAIPGLILVLLSMTVEVRADVSAWLDKVATAYGGEKQILAARAFQQYGVTYSSMRGREGNIIRSFRYPDRLRIAIDYGKHSAELRLLAGSHAWKQNQAVGEPFYSAMLLQATRLGLPAVLFGHKKYLKDGGQYTGAQGKALHLLELRFHKYNRITVGIDVKTGHIVESTSTIKMETFEMQFGTRYDDFRKVNGRLFAFKEIHYVMGRETGYTNLDRIVIDDLPDQLFYPEEITPERNRDETLAGLLFTVL